MAQFSSDLKKGSSRRNGTIFSGFLSDFPPQKGLRSSPSMGPMKPTEPSHGPLQAHGSPKPHGPPDGPPKIHGSRGHCPPVPPLGGPGQVQD